jgi:hypothetical protein
MAFLVMLVNFDVTQNIDARLGSGWAERFTYTPHGTSGTEARNKTARAQRAVDELIVDSQ